MQGLHQGVNIVGYPAHGVAVTGFIKEGQREMVDFSVDSVAHPLPGALGNHHHYQRLSQVKAESQDQDEGCHPQQMKDPVHVNTAAQPRGNHIGYQT